MVQWSLKNDRGISNMSNEALKFSTQNQVIGKISHQEVFRFCTAGSVDDGKSTLIGRLLFDTNNIFEDHLQSMQKKAKGDPSRTFSILTDGLRAEQEQGITIDVAYRYFSTPTRRFILADAPGHEQYTRNLATAASTADAMVLLIDAVKGISTQTRRHAFVGSLLQVRKLIVAINKMDLVDFSEQRFKELKAEFKICAKEFSFREIVFIPVAALDGDNVAKQSAKTPWYNGTTLLSALEHTELNIESDAFRFPIQGVLRPHDGYRGILGRISSGSIAVGDQVLVLPANKKTTIKQIERFVSGLKKDPTQRAQEGDSVTLLLEDDVDAARGDMVVSAETRPAMTSQFDATLIWFDDEPLNIKKEFILKSSTREVRASLSNVHDRVDMATLERKPTITFSQNDIGKVSINTTQQLVVDIYSQSRGTGSFILIDPVSYRTVAAGIVSDVISAEMRRKESLGSQKPVAKNITEEAGFITRSERSKHVAPKTLWCTGLSASGKSTIAKALERYLFDHGVSVFRLDGDNLRHGLNRDLGFSEEDRRENIRRTAEVAKLFNDAGVVVICSLISPLEKDRALAKELIGEDSFIEVYVSTSLEVCETRDPKGLYKKARAGELHGFTGISAPYEKPQQPSVEIDTGVMTLEEAVITLSRKLNL